MLPPLADRATEKGLTFRQRIAADMSPVLGNLETYHLIFKNLTRQRGEVHAIGHGAGRSVSRKWPNCGAGKGRWHWHSPAGDAQSVRPFFPSANGRRARHRGHGAGTLHGQSRRREL